MDERKMRILQAIIDDYILTGVPVGSRTWLPQSVPAAAVHGCPKRQRRSHPWLPKINY